jgi:hypothetical protein
MKSRQQWHQEQTKQAGQDFAWIFLLQRMGRLLALVLGTEWKFLTVINCSTFSVCTTELECNVGKKRNNQLEHASAIWISVPLLIARCSSKKQSAFKRYEAFGLLLVQHSLLRSTRLCYYYLQYCCEQTEPPPDAHTHTHTQDNIA